MTVIGVYRSSTPISSHPSSQRAAIYPSASLWWKKRSCIQTNSFHWNLTSESLTLSFLPLAPFFVRLLPCQFERNCKSAVSTRGMDFCHHYSASASHGCGTVRCTTLTCILHRWMYSPCICHVSHDCHLVDTWYTTDLYTIFWTFSSDFIFSHFHPFIYSWSPFSAAFQPQPFLSYLLVRPGNIRSIVCQLAWGEMGLLQYGPTNCMGNI